MLAKRIIPVILHKNGQLVKGERFVNNRVVGHALQAARIHGMRGVDELMILDISASAEQREPNYEFVKRLCDNVYIPVTVGGGVCKDEHVRELLNSGADKVLMGHAFRSNPMCIRPLADKYGSQCITVSVDYVDTKQAVELSLLAELNGCGEILLQDVNRDGEMCGYDLNTITEISRITNVPLIASCGCGSYNDMQLALTHGADAVAIGALFQFTDATPAQAAEYLNERGVEVRC